MAKAGAVSGVRLANGEEIEAPLVLSSLPGGATMALAGAPAPSPQIGEARLLISLAREDRFSARARWSWPNVPGFIADAHEAARAGRLPAELPMEFAAAALTNGYGKIAVTLRPVPRILSEEDRVQLAARAVQALARQVPGAASLVTGLRFSSSAPAARRTWRNCWRRPLTRVKTRIGGLYLCGADAEPVPSLSGRAARIAAHLALKARTQK